MEISNKRILVVDDEPISVTAAIDCLSDAGYKPKFVSSGAQAWKVLNKNPENFDAVLVDRVMPEIDGIDLLTMIKGSTKLQHLPVIIETATEDTHEYLAALDAGAADFIYKPLEKDFLLYVVDHALNNSVAQ